MDASVQAAAASHTPTAAGARRSRAGRDDDGAEMMMGRHDEDGARAAQEKGGERRAGDGGEEQEQEEEEQRPEDGGETQQEGARETADGKRSAGVHRTPKRARVTTRSCDPPKDDGEQGDKSRGEGADRGEEDDEDEYDDDAPEDSGKLPGKRRKKRRLLATTEGACRDHVAGAHDADVSAGAAAMDADDAASAASSCTSSSRPGGAGSPSLARERARQDSSVRALLSDLPQNGTFTRVRSDYENEYSRTLTPLPTLQPTKRRTSGRCKTVKNDDTNILVRALRLKKRKDREERKQRRAGTSSPSPTGFRLHSPVAKGSR